MTSRGTRRLVVSLVSLLGLCVGFLSVRWLGDRFGCRCSLIASQSTHSSCNSGDAVAIPLIIQTKGWRPIVLEKITTTCGCTRVSLDNQDAPLLPMIVASNDSLPLLVHLDTRGRSGLHEVVADLWFTHTSGKKHRLRFIAGVDVLPGATCLPNSIELETVRPNEVYCWVGSAQAGPTQIEKVEVSRPELLEANLVDREAKIEHLPHPKWRATHAISIRSLCPIDTASGDACLRIWLEDQEKPLEVPVILHNTSILTLRPETVFVDSEEPLRIRVSGIDTAVDLEVKFHDVVGSVIRQSNEDQARVFEIVLSKSTNNREGRIEFTQITTNDAIERRGSVVCRFAQSE